MADKELLVIRQILSELFPEPLEEEEAVALTAVLHRYNLLLAGKDMVATPVELTLSIAIAFVAKMQINGFLKLTSSEWLWHYTARYRDLHYSPEFELHQVRLAQKLSTHPNVKAVYDDLEEQNDS